jgi:hypothetical protein
LIWNESSRSWESETVMSRECEDHGWMRDRADPRARERAFAIAREEPPPGISTPVLSVK